MQHITLASNFKEAVVSRETEEAARVYSQMKLNHVLYSQEAERFLRL